VASGLDTPELDYNKVSIIGEIISICGRSGTGLRSAFLDEPFESSVCSSSADAKPQDSEQDLN